MKKLFFKQKKKKRFNYDLINIFFKTQLTKFSFDVEKFSLEIFLVVILIHKKDNFFMYCNYNIHNFSNFINIPFWL